MITQRHFEGIADVLRSVLIEAEGDDNEDDAHTDPVRQWVVHNVVDDLVKYFASVNPRFKKDLFERRVYDGP